MSPKNFHLAMAPLKLFALVFAFILPLSLLGCPSNKNQPSATPSDANSTAPKTTTDFDADRAFEHVRKQIEFGPRPAGSAELEKTRGYIIDQLKQSAGLNVTTDEFYPVTPQGGKKMVNIIAELPGESSDVIIISSHYDTKYFKEFKFVGANDGASSTGTLMEMARVLAQKTKPKLTYWFVFFDGEEAFCADWTDCHNPARAGGAESLPDNTYGSRYMVQQLITKNELKRVRAMILLDMMGSKNLRLDRPVLSSRWLVDIVWQTARDAGYGKQFTDGRENVDDDDHKPFLSAGIDALDIIQLGTYEEWHTKDDTLDKISPKSLKAVGDTVILSLPKIEDRIMSRT